MSQQWGPDGAFLSILFGLQELRIFLRESMKEKQREEHKDKQSGRDNTLEAYVRSSLNFIWYIGNLNRIAGSPFLRH